MAHEVSNSRTWLSEHRSVHLSLPSPHCLCLYHLAQNTYSCITLPPLVRPVALRHPSKSQLRSHPCKPEGFLFASGLLQDLAVDILWESWGYVACLTPDRVVVIRRLSDRLGPVSVHYPLPLFTAVQSLGCVQLFATTWTAACQASLSFTISRSLLKLMSIELIMPSRMYQTFNDIGYGT